MYPRKATPLLIVGRQRAGTRFLTDVLNSFDRVAIQGELPNPVMRSAVRMIRDIDAHYAKMEKAGDARYQRQHNAWLRKREYLIFSIWEHASQGARVKFDACTMYFGYKRPNNESYFDFYEASFRFRPPLYVYCTRNFVDNYLSIASRWPERTIEKVASDFLDSTAQYHRMVAAAPGRVLLFNLDDFVRHRLQYLEHSIITPLGLVLDEGHRQQLEQMRAKNRAEDLNVTRRTALTMDEQNFVRKHPELEREFAKLCFAPGPRSIHVS